MVRRIRGEFGEVYFIENRKEIRRVLKKLEKSGYAWRAGQGLADTKMRYRLRTVHEGVKGSKYKLYLMVNKYYPTEKDVVSYGVDLMECWR